MVRPNPTPDPDSAPPSDRRTAANRANARKSTGPRTAEGKQRSRMNALRHGLAAQTALIAGEDPADLDALARRMHDAHRPAPGLEEVLVERLVALAWRLRRTAAAEEAVADELEDRMQSRWLGRVQAHHQTGGLMSHPGEPPEPRSSAEIMADEFFKEDSPMLRLAAYEARLTSQLLATARQLEKLQKGRADAGEIIVEDEPPAQNEPTQNEPTGTSDEGQPMRPALRRPCLPSRPTLLRVLPSRTRH